MRTDKDYTKVKPKISGYLRGITSETTSNKIYISDDDFVYNTLTIRQATSDTDEITVGAAIISSCNFTLWNHEGKFDGWDWVNSAIELYLEFDSETVYIGSFVIISHTESGNTIKVEALDWLKVFDSHELGECNINWPVDAVSAVNTILTTGVQNMEVTGLDGLEGVMLANPGDDTMTNRDALSYIAQCLGKFIISRSDEETKKITLKFSWYNTDEAYSIGTTFSHQLRTDDINITGVDVTTSSGETTESRGDSTGYVVKIMDNPFVSADNVAAVADNVAAACLGLTFRPGEFVALGNVRIEAGDVVTIDTPKEPGVLTLATDITYKPSQIKESIVAHAEEAAGDLQIAKSAYVNKVIRDQLNNPNSPLGSAVGGGGSGGDVKFETGSAKKTRGSKWVALESSNVLGVYGATADRAMRCLGLSFKITSTPSGLSVTDFSVMVENMHTTITSGFSVNEYKYAQVERHVGQVFKYIPILVRVYTSSPSIASIEYCPATTDDQLKEGDIVSLNIILF